MFDKKLLSLLGKDKKYVVYIVICNILATIMNIAITFSIVYIVDDLIAGKTEISLYWIPFVVACVAVLFRFVLNRFVGHFQAKLGTNAKMMLRRKIYDKVAKLGSRQTDDLSLASLTQVSVEGVEQLDLYYSSYLPQFFFAVISPFILFILMMFISIPSAIVLICCVPLIPMSIIAVSKYAKKIFAKYWGTYTKMGDAFLDNVSGIKELKIYGADEARQKKMVDEAEEFRKITMKVLTMQLASTTIMDLVAYGGAGLGIAFALIFKQNVQPIFGIQDYRSMILFVVLTAVDFFLPLRALGSAFHVSMNGATAGKKILKLLETPEPTWGSKGAKGDLIEMKDVSFSYDGKRQILDQVSLSLKKGSFLAIVGKSGCGKSTIVSLLSGLRQGYQGNIVFGQDEIHTLSRSSYFRKVGVVSYNSYLFSDTIRNNFKMANPAIDDESIYRYLKEVNLDGFVRNNGGLDFHLQEGSSNLSGGQRQRLALAVNLSSEKPFYLFDEITSNIDVESEEIIMKNIEKLAKEKGVLMISHRLYNARKANEILLLDSGKIIERGSHAELLAKQGQYAELFQKQSELENSYKEEK